MKQNLPDARTSMDHPLEKDIGCSPKQEVCNPEPGEALVVVNERMLSTKARFSLQNKLSNLITEKEKLTKLFKAMSPRRKTAFTECIPISTYDGSKTSVTFMQRLKSS